MSREPNDGDTFANIADFAIAAAVANEPERSEADILRDLPGHGITALQSGMSRLRDRAGTIGASPEQMLAMEEVARAQFAKGSALCESPIERTMLGSLITCHWKGFDTMPPLVHDVRGDENLPEADLIIVPQLMFARFRLDFGLVAEIGGVKRIVAIECDGEQFHRNARKEWQRVSYLRSWGIPVFKFTGKEIHRSSMGAADKVAHAINEWRQIA